MLMVVINWNIQIKTVKECASLGVRELTILRWIKNGTLKSVRLPRMKSHRIVIEDEEISYLKAMNQKVM